MNDRVDLKRQLAELRRKRDVKKRKIDGYAISTEVPEQLNLDLAVLEDKISEIEARIAAKAFPPDPSGLAPAQSDSDIRRDEKSDTPVERLLDLLTSRWGLVLTSIVITGVLNAGLQNVAGEGVSEAKVIRNAATLSLTILTPVLVFLAYVRADRKFWQPRIKIVGIGVGIAFIGLWLFYGLTLAEDFSKLLEW